MRISPPTPRLKQISPSINEPLNVVCLMACVAFNLHVVSNKSIQKSFSSCSPPSKLDLSFFSSLPELDLASSPSHDD
ncbi:hypothetical protein SLEP1_g35192 [Rubroshorea leprosula]|uniref:Uncharacterized protein n=1 Tax=Rubroshorea leprosula TaxID=152421 RepID=A0AAV5KMT1_9ROSI|nr:hypothetical protein SLEP1_g35192 [Rubroshorea leprosula]